MRAKITGSTQNRKIAVFECMPCIGGSAKSGHQIGAVTNSVRNVPIWVDSATLSLLRQERHCSIRMKMVAVCLGVAVLLLATKHSCQAAESCIRHESCKCQHYTCRYFSLQVGFWREGLFVSVSAWQHCVLHVIVSYASNLVDSFELWGMKLTVL